MKLFTTKLLCWFGCSWYPYKVEEHIEFSNVPMTRVYYKCKSCGEVKSSVKIGNYKIEELR